MPPNGPAIKCVVFAILVQAFGRIRASRYKLTDVLICCHVAEFLKRADARSAYTVIGSLSRYQRQKAKTMTSLCTLLSVLGVVAIFYSHGNYPKSIRL